MLKIVLDTNMFISGILFHGMIKTVLNLVLYNRLQLYVSAQLQAEVVKKIKEFSPGNKTEAEVLLFLERRGILVKPKVKVTVCRDPKDNFILELAETAKADYIITRDKDLLDLPNKEWQGTKITKPEDFLAILRSS